MQTISSGDWKIMELLWASPRTLMELVYLLQEQESWSKSTVTTMVRRMMDKELIRFETDGRTKTFFPTVTRDEVAAGETTSFLRRVYNGSIGMLVNAMADRNSLTKEDINELYAILEEADKKL